MGRSGGSRRAGATLPARGAKKAPARPRVLGEIQQSELFASGNHWGGKPPAKASALDLETYLSGRGIPGGLIPGEGVYLNHGLVVSAGNSKDLAKMRNDRMREMRKALMVEPTFTILRPALTSRSSDFMTTEMARSLFIDFNLSHALHGQPVTQIRWEDAFLRALMSAGVPALRLSGYTHKGNDILVGEKQERFSLKSEYREAVSPDKISISKLTTAAWAGGLKTQSAVHKLIPRILESFDLFDRLITLRTFPLEHGGGGQIYELFEVPKSLLQMLENVPLKDCTKPTAAGFARIEVKDPKGVRAFQLIIDGRQAKIGIDKLGVDRCEQHAVWHISQAPVATMMQID